MKNKQALFDRETLKSDLHSVLAAFNSENDLTLALTYTSYIDACLTDYLGSKLRKSSVTDQLLSHKGALGNMFAKAQLTYALNYIEKEYYQDLITMAEVRNDFAHLHKKVSFKDPEIIEKCNKLNLPGLISPSDVEEENRIHFAKILENGRIRFSTAIVQLSNRLLYAQ